MNESATESLSLGQGRVRLRKMSLVVLNGPDAGVRIPVAIDTFIVGKEETCDLLIVDPTVSRRHFAIDRRGEDYLIRDLDSTNGTFVDGTRIREAFLLPGSKITAGNIELLFQPDYETAQESTSGSEEFGTLVAASPVMRTILSLLSKAGESATTVLLRGETGVGKSTLAKAVHDEGPRRDRPFVVFDCSSQAPTLIESELFGAEKGAYTGALKSRPGACEQANHGTLFLDEIGDLPLELQPKLLRVLEEKEVRRLGATKSIVLNIHVIAATKCDLEQAVKQGLFRRDLYYRIAIIDMEIPPLRDRPEDIPLITNRLLRDAEGPDAWSRLTDPLKEEFMRYSWPGNVRELRNVLERLKCIGPDGLTMTTRQVESETNELPLAFDLNRPFKVAKEELIDMFERAYLERLLKRSGGRIAQAAREAGLNRKYFYDLLHKHGLQGREQ